MEELIKVEYLMFIKNKEPYLNKETGFQKLIEVIDETVVDNNIITYNGLQITYKARFAGKGIRIINCEFTIDEKAKLEQFESFLRNFRTVSIKLCDSERKIETVWDDIGFYYANLAYPIINKIENKMRNLITKFMYINVSDNWVRENVPIQVEKSIKNIRADISFLHNVDFIKLTEFLFEEYNTKKSGELLQFIKTYNKGKTIEIEKLQEYIPKSNWDRFFKEKIKINGADLEKNWKELYQLRCQVAHNNKLIKEDYNKIVNLSKKVEESINKAFDNLSEIILTEEEKSDVMNMIKKNKFDKVIDSDEFEKLVVESGKLEEKIIESNYYPELIEIMLELKEIFKESEYTIGNLENWLHFDSHICFRVFKKIENNKYVFKGEMKGCNTLEGIEFLFERCSGEWLVMPKNIEISELYELTPTLIQKI
ncbi:hypothetical protein FDG50_05635 [Clostridium botulinum]|uniref:HEPN domain-containing protein n=1 Tax=Clostridium botulinum TaxID=1491 RepID=UPI0014013854|nr:HEPN domain-containing protein [Clostridium botulinum]MBY6836865.1 hypothetical protein [Clostridium botulinum]NFG64078.1 hypothetical protein [Clostridium botulinum]NFQ23622.1 hypothetical protein [Clostridium botulinum]